MPRPRRRLIRGACTAALALAAPVLLAGCDVDATVDVALDDVGRGTVTATVALDPEAASFVPDLREQLRADDLIDAGWAVAGPTGSVEDGFRISATRRVRSPAEVADAMAELAGPGGPLASLSAERDRSFLRTTVRVEGDVDLSAGLAAFGDEGLRARLGGSTGLGIDDARVEELAGRPVGEAFELVLRTHLPGEVEAAGAAVEDGVATWRVPLGSSAEVSAVGSRTNRAVVGWTIATAVFGVAWVLVLGAPARRERRRLRREGGEVDGVEGPQPGRFERGRSLEDLGRGGEERHRVEDVSPGDQPTSVDTSDRPEDLGPRAV